MSLNCVILIFVMINIFVVKSSEDLQNIYSERLRNNSRNVSIGTAPFIVSIQRGDAHHCCGTIIDLSVILTAAHCVVETGPELVYSNPLSYVVIAGQQTLGSGNFQLRRPQFIHVHDQFEKTHKHNNIALMILFEPFKTTSTVDVITTSTMLSQPYVNFNECHIVSWTSFDDAEADHHHLTFKTTGLKSNLKDHFNLLQIIRLPTLNHKECASRINEHVVSMDNICTEYGTHKPINCYVDGGSPLICNRRQYGIFSWGIGCLEQDYPGVFTAVSKYDNWINKARIIYNIYKSSSKDSKTVSTTVFFLIIILYLTVVWRTQTQFVY